MVVAAVAVLAIAIAVVVGSGNDDDLATTVGDAETSTTTTTEATTSSSAPADADTTATTATTAAPTTTSTSAVVPAAENRCGAASSGDGSDALVVEACVVDRARVGETVRATIRASDGDARVRDDCASPWVDWGESEQATCAIGCGPSPAPTGPSSIEVTREHVYTEPGRYPIRVVVESNCGQDPYGDIETVDLGSIEIT